MTTNEMPVTLTVRQLAELLQVSLKTIDRMRAARVLPPPLTLPGHYPRWSTAAILEWMAIRSRRG